MRLRQHRLLLFWLLCDGHGPRRAICHEVGRHRLNETDNHGLGRVGVPRHHRVDDGIVLDGVRLEVPARVPEQEVLGRVIRDRTNTGIHPVGTDHAEERGPNDLVILDVVDLQPTRVVVPQQQVGRAVTVEVS